MAYDLKIFTENIEPVAVNQIYNLLSLPPFADSKVRIMPDVHLGSGCVVGCFSHLSETQNQGIASLWTPCIFSSKMVPKL